MQTSPHGPVLLSRRRIEGIVRKLARRIDDYCRTNSVPELTVICVLDGAFIFTADLVRAMATPTRIVFLKARSYRGTRKGSTSTEALPGGMRGRAVLVADTVYDTGMTIAKVVRAVRRQTTRVCVAVLVEKPGKALVALRQQADAVFTGIPLSGDPFLIGYGLDVNGQFRELPDIRRYDPVRDITPQIKL